MALLVTLAVIGGITGLVALYILGTYLVAEVVGHTKLFTEKITAVIEDYRARRAFKKAKKQAKQENHEDEKVIEIQ